MDELLAVGPSMIIVDNAPPLYFGFSLGFYLVFHGHNNRVSVALFLSDSMLRLSTSQHCLLSLITPMSTLLPHTAQALKSKLFRVYAKLCPALLQGHFMDTHEHEEKEKVTGCCHALPLCRPWYSLWTVPPPCAASHCGLPSD